MSNDAKQTGGQDSERRPPGVIEEILAEAQEDRNSRDERVAAADARVLRPRRRGLTATQWLVMLLPVLVLLTAGNVILARKVPELFSADDEEARARLDIYLAATAIATYEDVHEELPASLEELGLDLPDLSYEPQGAGFRLIAHAGLRRLVYCQGDDLSAYAPRPDVNGNLALDPNQTVETNQ